MLGGFTRLILSQHVLCAPTLFAFVFKRRYCALIFKDTLAFLFLFLLEYKYNGTTECA